MPCQFTVYTVFSWQVGWGLFFFSHILNIGIPVYVELSYDSYLSMLEVGGSSVEGNVYAVEQLHQEFQVPKMEGFLNLIFGCFRGWGFPYIGLTYSLYG